MSDEIFLPKRQEQLNYDHMVECGTTGAPSKQRFSAGVRGDFEVGSWGITMRGVGGVWVGPDPWVSPEAIFVGSLGRAPCARDGVRAIPHLAAKTKSRREWGTRRPHPMFIAVGITILKKQLGVCRGLCPTLLLLRIAALPWWQSSGLPGERLRILSRSIAAGRETGRF
jgi:hypothetical protein